MIKQTVIQSCSESPLLSVPIVLLHGWGVGSQVWQSVLDEWSPLADLVLLDSDYQEANIEQWCEQLYQQLPEKSILCGWSLGGMLATAFTARFPERVAGLITLATNLQFVADDQWHSAMPTDTFETFYQSFINDPQKTLKRFMGLIVQGDSVIREQRSYLQANALAQWQPEPLLVGLDWLRDMNHQHLLSDITCPTLHLLGEHDQLVPVVIQQKISLANSQHQINIVNDAGHLLHMPVLRIASVIETFLQELADAK